MTGTLSVRNRQRVCRVNTILLRQILRALLMEGFRPGAFELCFHLVDAVEMTRVNQKYLGHAGSTDVITFDHSEAGDVSNALRGEIYICLDDAVAQSRLYRTTWAEEVVRYAIHGLLHLSGHDDLTAAARRVMKREENRLLRQTKAGFPIARLAQK